MKREFFFFLEVGREGAKLMEIYGRFEGFPLSALFGLVL